MGKSSCIMPISFADRIKIHTLSIVFGILVVCKMLAKWLWDSKSFSTVQQRDRPPPCLLDSFLGQHKYIKLKGTKFHYVEGGNRGRPLVLLLHGFPDCWLSWRHQISELVSNSFHVVALDLKGFGDSDKPANRKAYRVHKVLDELHGIIKTFGVEQCTIIGHDIGAMLGWCLAQQFPDVVERLVVVSCPHPNEHNFIATRTCWLNFVQLPYFPEIDALKDDVKIISEYHKHLPPKDIYLEAYKYTFSRKVDWSGALNYYRNFPYFEIAANANAVQVPVLLVIGNKDKLVHLESIVKSTDYCEKFYLKIIDGTEHFPHQENPSMFNNVLLKFLIKDSVIGGLHTRNSQTKGLMDMMFGAVSNTMKYGNSMLDIMAQKKPAQVGIPSMGLLSFPSLGSLETDTLK